MGLLIQDMVPTKFGTVVMFGVPVIVFGGIGYVIWHLVCKYW